MSLIRPDVTAGPTLRQLKAEKVDSLSKGCLTDSFEVLEASVFFFCAKIKVAHKQKESVTKFFLVKVFIHMKLSHKSTF